jgi:hypothetical protein
MGVATRHPAAGGRSGRVLFIVQETAHFGELMALARLLAATGRYEPDFGFYVRYAADTADRARLDEAGFRWFDASAEHRPPAGMKDRLRWLAGFSSTAAGPASSPRGQPSTAAGPNREEGGRMGVKQTLKRLLAFPKNILRATRLPRFALALMIVRRRIAAFRRRLRERKPEVVVLAEDNVGHTTGVFTRVAREFGCPVVVVPFTVADAREAAESFFNEPEYQVDTWQRRRTARRYPHWHYVHHDRPLLRLPWYEILAQEWFGIAPPQPWALNSGSADAILVESTERVDYYRTAGLASEPLLPVGSAFDDEMARLLADRRAARDDLDQRHGLDPAKPLVICALPPDQLPGRPHPQFDSFESLVRAWLKPWTEQQTFNVVVRLHPRLRRDEFAFIECDLGLAISERPTSELIAAGDAYVASASATIRWAAACGKPTINYDVFGYRYDDFSRAGGVAHAATHAEYEQLVRRLYEGPTFYLELLRRARACRPRWGNLDGRGTERMIQVFDYLTTTNTIDRKELEALSQRAQSVSDGSSANDSAASSTSPTIIAYREAG